MSWEDLGGGNEEILVVLYVLVLFSRGEAGGSGVIAELLWKRTAVRDGVER